MPGRLNPPGGLAVPKDTPTPLLEEIKLLAPHTHAGRDYPAGARLNLRLQIGRAHV